MGVCSLHCRTQTEMENTGRVVHCDTTIYTIFFYSLVVKNSSNDAI